MVSKQVIFRMNGVKALVLVWRDKFGINDAEQVCYFVVFG